MADGNITLYVTTQHAQEELARLLSELAELREKVGVRCAVPTRADVDALMKRCQIGVGGSNALDRAHSIMAECYGTLGALMLTVERYAATLAWIEGATTATPGLTQMELGILLASIGAEAGGELRAPNVANKLPP